MNYLDIEKIKKKLRKEVLGYSEVSVTSFKDYTDALLDIIDDLQKENEEFKKQVSKPIIKEKIVYRKR